MMRRRPVRAAGIALILACATLTACANQQGALRLELATLNAARDGFIAWDDAHQGDIVKKATSLEEGKAELASYRGKREVVVRAFEVGYKMVATAALDPTTDNLALLAANLLDLKGAVTALGAAWPKGAP